MTGVIRIRVARQALVCAGMCLSFVTSPPAQEAGSAESVDAKYDDQLIEEIVVRGSDWRRPRNDEPEWRRVEPAVKPPPRVRMSLGYDIEREREMRLDSALQDMSQRTPEPATVIRFRF